MLIFSSWNEEARRGPFGRRYVFLVESSPIPLCRELTTTPLISADLSLLTKPAWTTSRRRRWIRDWTFSGQNRNPVSPQPDEEPLHSSSPDQILKRRFFATNPICALISAYMCFTSHSHRRHVQDYFPKVLCRDQESNSCQLSCTYLRDLNSGRFTDWATAAMAKRMLNN